MADTGDGDAKERITHLERRIVGALLVILTALLGWQLNTVNHNQNAITAIKVAQTIQYQNLSDDIAELKIILDSRNAAVLSIGPLSTKVEDIEERLRQMERRVGGQRQ